jgi:hypothetical protein
MKSFLMALAAATLLAGCISTELPQKGASDGSTIERRTGSNLTRGQPDATSVGTMERDDLEKAQRGGPLKGGG